MNPFVFIVGCHRSGNTLLQRIVNAHPLVAIPRESHWIPEYFEERRGLTPEGWVTPELISCLLENPKFTRLQIGREELEALQATEQPMPYASFVTGIFDLYGKAQGKALVGDKTPGYVRKLRTLHALWPRARFVHLIRDGRDVCLAMLAWCRPHPRRPQTFATWKDDPVSTAAVWWGLNVRLGRDAGKSLGPELYYEMRYESLVARPAEECAALCAFLGVPYEEAMLRFHEGRTRKEPGLTSNSAWLPVTPALRDWRSQMPAEDVERFEAGVGELLGELGYSRAFPHPRPEAVEQASRTRDRLARDHKSVRRVIHLGMSEVQHDCA